jgi:ring-1,2-phenylacetyl-CoA epoxidase subunit PaaE
LFYGNKKYEEIIFREELERLEEKYQGRLIVHHILSQEQKPGCGFGRLDTPRVDSEAHQGLDLTAVSSYYLCGPAEMIFSLKDHLVECGVIEDRIRFELFSAPVVEVEENKDSSSEAPSQGSGALVNTYILDGERFEVEVKDPEMTILDIGLSHGIDLPFACQGGVCCTCRAKVQSGKVDMRQNFSLGDNEVNDGYVLTCQSYPQGESATLDYDS